MESAWIALALTLKVAGCATALNLLLGVGVGYAMARWRFPGRELADAVLTLPMVMPPTVLGYYLQVKIKRTPKCCSNHPPSGPCVPITTNM